MLNVKKLLTNILTEFGCSQTAMRGYTLGSDFSVTAKSYPRIAIIIPWFYSINSFKYKTAVVSVPANATSLQVGTLAIDGGTFTTSATIDAIVLLLRAI